MIKKRMVHSAAAVAVVMVMLAGFLAAGPVWADKYVIDVGDATGGAISGGAITGGTINGGTINGTTISTTGAANIGTTLGVTGLTTLNGGATVNGTTNINGATKINDTNGLTTDIATGAAATTNIGNAGGANNIIGTTGITGATIINGATNINNANGLTTNIAAGAAATTNIGFTGGANNIIGTTSINTSINNATNINTGTSTSAVTIGNSANTTNLNSAANNIGTTATFATTNKIGTDNAGTNASTNIIGNINAGTTVTATGGKSVLSIANTQASLTADTIPNLATNGTSGRGTELNNKAGGLTVFNTKQTIVADTTIQTTLSPNGILNQKEYQNKINGNLFVDGNVYINGTLDYVSSNAANTTVVGTAGTSNLSSTQGTTAGTAIVMKGSPGTQTVVDANGKMTNIVTAGAAQSTAALTLTNGDGKTHGIVVTETQTSISGGRNSSSLTLHDDGATFANTVNGAPVRVHGVDDGTAPYDAVNVRQMSAGLAMVAGLAALPQVDAGKKFAIGIGTGGYMSTVSLAAGLSARIRDNFLVKAGAAFVPDYGGNAHTVWNAGLQYSF